MNQLYYGDNLDILKRYIKDESVDLIYLDPPFNSNATYNVLFSQQNGSQSSAQIQAFEDTWQWDENAALNFELSVERGGAVADTLRAFRMLLGNSNMMAYLAMMAPRLLELHRVLQDTGSLYLHCDPTASHYLRILLDTIFGGENFKNEIIWKRTSAHSAANKYGAIHDTILFYTKSNNFTWNVQYQPYDQEYIDRFFDTTDEDGRKYKRSDLTGAGTTNGPSGEPWRGRDVRARGRHWMYVPSMLDELDEQGRIHWPKKEGGMPRLKQYPEDLPGLPIQDIWTDIRPIHNLSEERLGYPTQKPEELLDRIIKASSNEGEIILDPFCGCGTAIASAQKNNRNWIGIDITHLAIGLIKIRMADQFGEELIYEVYGEPTTIEGAQELADMDKFQFEWWALGLVGARPADPKKGADRGIDGRLFFHDDDSGKTKQVIISVKGGHTGVSHIRDLVGVLDRENAQIGVLLTLQEPTQPMRSEAASAGFYDSPWGKHPRVQILTIEELLDGKQIDMPPIRQVNQTYRRAPKHKGDEGKQLGLLDD
ncbi:MAG: DNA methyltransferase [Marinimicrobia bacterium 46_43]|jgi:DNA modification methylase|nr:MAG: DNA methyltransferase [Marinimicrobia bacterium 46_43]